MKLSVIARSGRDAALLNINNSTGFTRYEFMVDIDISNCLSIKDIENKIREENYNADFFYYKDNWIKQIKDETKNKEIQTCLYR